MMEQDMTTKFFKWNQRPSWRALSVTLTILVALVLMTTVAFAQPSGDPYTAPSESSSASSTRWTIRADANPSMPVALWYAPTEASSPSSTRWTIRADANPSMPVALWYAPASADAQDQLCAAGDLACP